MMGVRIFFKLKNMGTKILKFSLNQITPTQITPTWITLTQITLTQFPSSRQTQNQKINMIWPIIVHYTKWCCIFHMIHNPVHFLLQHPRHIIKCHSYIHSLCYSYHTTPLTEPVTLHHHQMAHRIQQALHLQ